MIWHWLAAATMIAVAATHSFLGERRLIGPLIAGRQGVLARELARRVMRFAWHVTSLFMIACAATVAWPGVPAPVIALVGAVWLAAGIADAAMTRGRHIGWPFLTAAGVFALAAAGHS